MRSIRFWSTAAALALSLAACGGGDDPSVVGEQPTSGAPNTRGSFTAVVSFGDSLSDVGTYLPATSATGNGQPPYIGGKFTTNSATGTVWVENVATALNLRVTPAEVGFNGQSAKCPAAAINAALAGTCTAYGQGGSRVTNPAGIGKRADGSGALTVPVQTQIANHLARFGSFKASDLIFVYAGANDVLVQLQTFAAQAAPIQAAAAAGTITPDDANQQLYALQLAGQEALKEAAGQLAGYVKSDILAKGGQYVAVMNVPNVSVTPLGSSLTDAGRGVLTGFVQVFNLWLADGLNGQPVQFIDAYANLNDAVANPGTYGFVNTTVPACDAAKISAITGGLVPDGSSLFCNATAGLPYNGLRAGADVNTWLFADSIHPTTGGHLAFGTYVLAQIRAFGWIQ